jgi:predicted RNase H-like nuclease (RuvC/YqgF family)
MIMTMENNKNLKDEIVAAIDKRMNERFESFAVKMDQRFESFTADVDRRFDLQGVLLEDMNDKIELLAEGQDVLHGRIDRLQGDVSKIEARVERIDSTLMSFERNYKKEMTALDRRVAALEN